MDKLTCCFTGHRPEGLPWGDNEGDPACLAFKAALDRELEVLYRRGFRRFICGMARGGDLYFAEAVLRAAEQHPDMELEGAIPHSGQERSWPEADRLRYRSLVDRCSRVKVLHERYFNGCMLARNRYMVDRASLVVALYSGSVGGGTGYTLKYALDKKREVLIFRPQNPWGEPVRVAGDGAEK